MKFPQDKSRSAELYRDACKVMPGGNSRTSLWWPPYPVYARSGHGAHVTDVEGDTRLDFHNAFSALVHGHSHPAIVERVCRQAETLMCVGMPTQTEIELAQDICGRLTGADHIRFCNSGTEATMTALKAARGYNGRARFAKCEGCYHGSYETLELSTSSKPDNWGDPDAPNAVPQSKGTPKSTVEEAIILPFNNIAATRRLLEHHAHEIAAVFIDPVPVRMGLIRASDAYLEFLRDFTENAGIVLIFDEVVTLRMHRGGYQGAVGIEPDLSTLGKMIGGGLPVGAIAGKADFMAVFDPGGAGPDVWHGGTFNANPMTMAAGIASMDLMTDAAYAHMNDLGAQARDALGELFARRGIGWQVSGYGSMFRFHAHARPINDYRSFFPRDGEGARAIRMMNHLLNRGILMTRIGVGSISSVMTSGDIDQLVAAVDESLTQMIADGDVSPAKESRV